MPLGSNRKNTYPKLETTFNLEPIRITVLFNEISVLIVPALSKLRVSFHARACKFPKWKSTLPSIQGAVRRPPNPRRPRSRLMANNPTPRSARVDGSGTDVPTFISAELQGVTAMRLPLESNR